MITGAVVTIPALFNKDQEAATRNAAEMAGLDLKYLVHEPTAAAIAYNARKKLGDSMLLTFDFGGGMVFTSEKGLYS